MPSVLRGFAFAMYVMYSLAGLVFIFLPSTVVTDNTNSFKVFVWHFFLLAGGACSLYGVFRRKPIFEAIGIPLLSSGMLAYAVILIATALDEPSMAGPRMGVGFLFIGTVLGLVGRLVETLWITWVDAKLEGVDE